MSIDNSEDDYSSDNIKFSDDDILGVSNDSSISKEEPLSLSDVLRFIHNQHQDTQDELASEQAVDDLYEQIKCLEEKNEEMSQKINNIQTSVPVPAYISIIIGIFTLLYLSFSGFSTLIFIGGIGLICIGLTAVYESKVRMKRI